MARRARGWRLVVVALLPTVLLLAVGEIAARIVYARQGGMRYLFVPYGFEGRYPYPVGRVHVAFDTCSQRTLTRTSNASKARGGDWPVAKTPGRLRIHVTGGSSTFGLNSPDDATWPVFLERALRARFGRDVEVLNAGRPAQRIEMIRATLMTELPRYRPDVVIYYEGYNNIFNAAVTRLHDRHPLVSTLYYRSMLYTYVVEKVSLRLGRWEDAYLHEKRLFRTEVDALLRLVRAHDARPVFVLQVTRQAPDPALATLDVDDDDAVVSFVRRHASDAGSLRAYQAQVLIEIVRRAGQAAGVTVVDPRDAFVGRPAETLFCDEIHLTDAGNALLAETVAARFDPWAR